MSITSSEDLAVVFSRVSALVARSSNSNSTWKKILETANIRNQSLQAIDIESEADALNLQLSKIWAEEPVPLDATYLYFGLFDIPLKGETEQSVGFYVAGGNAKDHLKQISDGKTPY